MSSGTSPVNVLASIRLSKLMLASLPEDASSQSPQLTHTTDAVALAANASMLAVGFRLVGLSDTQRLDPPSTAEAPLPLPSNWHADKQHYTFRYRHTQSSLEFLLKVMGLGRNAMIIGKAVEHDRSVTYELLLDDFISNGNLPYSINNSSKSASASAEAGDAEAQKDAARKALEHVFITPGRLSDFGSVMRLHIIQKLVPSVQKEGYEEEQQQRETAGAAPRDPPRHREPTRERPDEDAPQPGRAPFPIGLEDPRVLPPRRPGQLPEPMPGFEDEHQMMPGFGRGPGMMPGFRYGEDDLHPMGMGPNDGIRGGVGPGYGVGPMGGGGMHMRLEDLHPGGRDPRNQYDPQVPPGARYDPVGPGMGGFPQGPGRRGGPPNPFNNFDSNDFI